MLQRTLMPVDPAPQGNDTTYGDLVERSRSALAEAATLAPDRFTKVEDARRELKGYLSFLRTAGQHVELLGRLVGPDAEDVRSFGRNLATAAHRHEGQGPWQSAATCLGAADDLVKSHLDLGLMSRTSEGEDFLTTPRLLAAIRETVQLLSGAAAARSRLTRLVTAVERGPSGDGHASDDLVLAARRAERHIHLHGRAAMWDLHRLGIDDTSPGFETLRMPVLTVAAPSPMFASALAALRALRQLSYDQANSRVPASPASLRDLTRLGEAATVPGLDWLPQPDNGLARVRQAALLDGLNAAHDHWSRAGRHLTTTVQGLTQAPARYGEAVRLLQTAVHEAPVTRMAVITALPALATDASRMILGLAGEGSLVTRQRVPMHLHARWARIPFEDAHSLIQAFETAGQTSRAVAETVDQLARPPRARDQVREAMGRRPVERHLEQRLSR